MNRRNFIRNSGWTLFGLAASGTSFISCTHSSSQEKFTKRGSDYRIFWGDLHNHCNLTYGHGDLRSAFDAAREQLDFVAVTPHALWPDIPGRNDERLAWVIDYHTGAFQRLRDGGYDRYLAMNREYDKEGEFLAFVSYECHSMEHGDHVVLNYDLDAPLLECTSVEDLKAQLKGKRAFVTPHHMGYQQGYRGYNWGAFSEGEQTPFVEIFSRHGLAESDQGDYNYLHDMGPRRWDGTALYGLEQGHMFGMMASTDQHAGYPGSYGDGRIAVLAKSLNRDEIWNAMQNRRVYAVTGDKIMIDFRINGACMGEKIRAGSRQIYLFVEGDSAIDYVDIVKNGESIARMNGPLMPPIPEGEAVRAKIKINFGWNRDENPVKWEGGVELSDGVLTDVMPMFRGAAYTSPQKDQLNKEGDTHKTHVNRVIGKTDKRVDLEMYTTKNPNVLTPAMQGVMLDVNMPKSGKITVKFNGKEFGHTLEELFNGAQSHFMIGWLSEAVQFCRACPENAFSIGYEMMDHTAERAVDYYYVRVRQRDGQWAWSSPIWVEKG